MQRIEDELMRDTVLYGSPDFMDIPPKIKEQIEVLVMAKERMFWLNAGQKIPKDTMTETMVRRCLYGEIRGLIMEDKLGEMAFVMQKMAELKRAEVEAQNATKQ